MNIMVADASTLGDDLNLDALKKFGDLKVFPTPSDYDLIEEIKDTDVIIVNKVKLNETNLKYAKNLKLICVAATGFDNIDVPYCKENGIAVCNVVGYSTHSVAQVTIAMALSLYTNLPQFTSFVKSGDYSRGGVANKLTPYYHELCGKTWGILGLGNIGSQVARVASALGCKVIVCSRTEKEGFTNADIDTLCKESDILSIHTPLTEKTRHIINAERLSLMKKNAVLINVARGAVTDESAVANAVKQGQIGALGVDVYDGEPMSESSPLYAIKDLDNVVFTPHMAWGSVEARNLCLEEIMKNIEEFINGGTRNRLDLM